MFSENMVISRILDVFNGEVFPAGTKKRYSQQFRNCELIYYFSGDCTVQYNGTIYPTGAGTLRFLPMTEKHTEYVIQMNVPFECIVIKFLAENVPDTLVEMKIPNSERLRNLFRWLCTVWHTRAIGYQKRTFALFYEILEEIEKQTLMKSDRYIQISRAVEYIRQHCRENISVETLAKMCGLHYKTMKTIFLQNFHMTPKEYIIEKRLEAAMEMLITTNRTIGEIAYSLSYEDCAYFSRLFKKKVGCTPGEYRIMHSKKPNG